MIKTLYFLIDFGIYFLVALIIASFFDVDSRGSVVVISFLILEIANWVLAFSPTKAIHRLFKNKAE